MSSETEKAVLYFDLHFKLVNSSDEIIQFLEQFKVATTTQSEFTGNIEFQSLSDILRQNKHIAGLESGFEKELESMFGEIKLEICRRLKTMIAFEIYFNILKEDWKKIKVLNSVLIDLKEQGIFFMINQLLKQHDISLGKRIDFEEKFKPFSPKLNATNAKNHTKMVLKADKQKNLKDFHVGLNLIEIERIFLKTKEKNVEIAASELPEEIIYEKIIPKIIDGYSLEYNLKTQPDSYFKEAFNIENYTLMNL
ncbi:hypothetical protein [Marivirga sp.]|uniref:hypothetical protein n=1 Tax=Marivirga sp. TaxID=2018662 RepID=UPI002D800D68|nr:hypothetical protein [Marivirga sp.]HET8859308.1 hypothetical protein [Marivirga sp.]